MIIEIKANDGRINSNSHPVNSMAVETHEILNENWRSVDLLGLLETDVDGRTYGLSPDVSDMVDDVIQQGILPFSLEEMMDKVNSGDSDGSANVTAIHVLLGNSLEDSIKELVETDQLDAAVQLFENIRSDDDPTAVELVAYTVFTYGKGWIAEQIVTDHDRFSKLWITNDQAGQDMRDLNDDDEKQLKPVTTYAGSSRRTFKNAEIEHYFYQWTEDGLVVADLDDVNQANKMAAKQGGVSATSYKKSYSGGVVDDIEGRSARVLWWA